MRVVLVDFSAKSINHYYNLDPVPSEPFDRLHEQPNYSKVIRVLTNGQGQWKLNSEGHAVHFQAKHLAYIPKVWHYIITSSLIPTTNVCEVTAKRVLLNYPILHNRDAKMNLGHPFLIYGLCKQVGLPLEDNEAWIHPIESIMVKLNKPGVPRPEAMYDSGNEPSDEDELREYLSCLPDPDPTRLADPNLSPRRNTIYTIYCMLGLSLTCSFSELTPVPVFSFICTISVITKMILHIQKNYHRSGVHHNL